MGNRIDERILSLEDHAATRSLSYLGDCLDALDSYSDQLTTRPRTPPMTDAELILNARNRPAILWQDARRAAVLHPSTNRKTGAPFSIAIYNKPTSPERSHGSGCSSCPLHNNGCYAEVGPESFTHKRRAAGLENYPELPRRLWSMVFGGLFIRIGSYGDPATIPARILRTITSTAGGHTGYTHQWRNVSAADYAPFLMASVETLEDVYRARRAGWRVFAIVRAGTWQSHKRDRRPARAILGKVAHVIGERVSICPHWTTGGRVTCRTCPTPCNGTTDSRLYDILIPAHGTKATTTPAIEMPPK